jgi:FkbH-like protein
MSREEFLESLNVRVSADAVEATDDPAFPRAFELINKTNQFNSTGLRWDHQSIVGLFGDGGRLIAFSVVDEFADYGLTAVAIECSSEVLQFVMSCRVFGLEVERRAFDHLADAAAAAGEAHLSIQYSPTESNSLVVEALQRNGFQPGARGWQRPVGIQVAAKAA